jgi:hypothetical protein
MWPRDWRERFMRGRFDLALPRATLSQLSPTPGKPLESYEGSADISINDQGRLELRFLCPTAISIASVFSRWNVEAGEAIPPHMLFSFRGMEIDRREWTCESLYPDMSSGAGGTIIKATLSEITSRSTSPGERPVPNPLVTSYYAVKPRFTGRTRQHFGQNTLEHPDSSDDFGIYAKGAGWRLALHIENEWFSSHAEADDELFDGGFTDKVVRALEFWSGTILEPIYEIVRRKTEVRVFIRSRRRRKTQTGYPPVSHNPSYLHEELNLVVRFLDHAVRSKSSTWSPIVIHSRSAMTALDGPLELAALGLSVAVEGMVKAEFANVRRAGRIDHSAATDDLISRLSADASLDAEFRERVVGSLRNLKNVRPGDILRGLEERDLIPPKSERVWQQLRNPAAHADQMNAADIDKLYRRCLAVLALAHQLVFLAIGYQGPYTNHSKRGWPTEHWTATYPQCVGDERDLG